MAARLTTYVVVAIVAATLIAGLIVGAQRDDSSGPVDLIIHNARVYTADAHGTIEQAIAVRGNTILRVGSDREVMRYRRPQTQVIDAKGAAVLPGFDDAHATLVATGLAQNSVDLSDAATVEDLQQRIADWAAAHPSAPWISAHGWNSTLFADGQARTLLDRAVKDRPVLLVSDDGLTAWANSAALRRARIVRHQGAGRTDADIVRDRRGEATGILRGRAIEQVRTAAVEPSRAERAAAIRSALVAARGRGITSVHEFAESAADMDLYASLRSDIPEMRLARVYVGVPVVPSSPDPAAGLDDLARQLPDDPLVKTGFAYLPADTRAVDLDAAVSELDAHAWQVAVAAPTADAVSGALDAFERAASAHPSNGDLRHRLEGVEAIRPEDLRRFTGGRWIASIAPREMPLDGLLFPLRAAPPSLDVIAWPMRSLEAHGAHLAFGSDGPARPADPLAAIAAVVSRESEPDEALTLKSAINGWTSGAAWASFDEHRKGMLAPGMLADLVVLSTDIFKTPLTSLASARVDMTVFDGKIVYRRKTS